MGPELKNAEAGCRCPVNPGSLPRKAITRCGASSANRRNLHRACLYRRGLDACGGV